MDASRSAFELEEPVAVDRAQETDRAAAAVDLRLLAKETLVELVELLMETRRVGGPLLRDGLLTFGFLEEAQELVLSEKPTFASFKAATFPASEVFLNYELNGKPSAEAIVESPPTIVIGLHPCDIAGLQFMDRYFGGGEWDAPADPNYTARRKALTVIGLDCMHPCDSDSFCRDMQSLEVHEGFDAMLVDLGDSYLVEIPTEAGKAVFDLAESQPAPESALVRAQELRQRRADSFPRRLQVSLQGLPGLLNSNMSHPVWQAMGNLCLSCGSCTAVCPTCFCFDVIERLKPDMTGGERCRIWDSCQLRSFATVAGGRNFREERSSRQRHFTMHKSAYIPQSYGVAGCVGCGRCIRTCPVHISQIEIYNRLAREA